MKLQKKSGSFSWDTLFKNSFGVCIKLYKNIFHPSFINKEKTFF